jgi:hypothetical protein
MSHWGILDDLHTAYNLFFFPIFLTRKLHLSTNLSKFYTKDIFKLIEIFVGFLDGDGYFDIGPQKQYNQNPDNKPKSTIRMRLGINLQYTDKGLLELFQTKLGVGKINYSKSKNQYRLVLFKTDILNVIYPYLQSNNIEFLNYNRRKQYFLFKYIIENNIKHWENLNLEEINNLFLKTNKQIGFTEIMKLPYFYNWLVGFTVAEGSFHINSIGSAHYSIVQSGIENYNLIKAIHYFIKGSSSFDNKIISEDSKVYRISFSSKIDLTFIMNFFDINQLLGLKKIQYDNWRSYVINNNKIISSAPNVLLSKISTNKVLTNTNNNNNNDPRNE